MVVAMHRCLKMIKLKDIIKEIEGDIPNPRQELVKKIEQLQKDLISQFPQLLELHIYLRSAGDLYVNSLRVKPNERRRGIGRKVMNKILEFVDENNLYLTLHPSPEPRYKAKLQQFYKSFGLKPNKGRRTLFQYADPFHINWIRRPVGGGPKNVM